MLVSQSIPTIDFFYVCVTHLGDRHFASRVADPPGASGTERLPDKVSASEIEKVKAEYEAKQREKEKRDKEKREKEEKEQQDKDKAEKAKASMASSVFSTITSTVSGLAFPGKPDAPTSPAKTATDPPPAPVNPYPLHAKYALHREFYAARTREWNNRNFKKRERELNMPPAPRNALG